MKTQKPEEVDRLLPLKHIGYCWSQMPPSDEGGVEYADFLEHAKFSLCRLTNRLMKDTVWDEYTSEEILAEYFAHVFSSNKDAREKFEAQLGGASEEMHDWLDRMIAGNQGETDKKIAELGLEDSLSFVPGTIGETE